MKKLFRFFKNFSVITLVLITVFSSVEMSAYALTFTPQETIYFEDYCENPLYWDAFEGVDIQEINGEYIASVRLDANKSEADAIRAAAIAVRDKMIERKGSFSITIESARTDYSKLVDEIFKLAISEELADTPTAGDYLAFQYGGYGYNGSASYVNGAYKYTFNFTVPYYTTAAQEEKVNTAVKKALGEMNINNLTEYEKVKAVYDYVCRVCNYSTDTTSKNNARFSAYGAIINGSAVCQGYATLLYRMLKESGINNKIITSPTHAWNIARIDGVYYNLDATWDDHYYDRGLAYAYFLTCNSHFEGHDREYQYRTDVFNKNYKMTNECYYHKYPNLGKLGQATCNEHNYVLTKTVAANCEKAGYKLYICQRCNEQKKTEIKAIGHKVVIDKAVKATYATAGKTQGSHCSVCKKVLVAQKAVPKLTVAKTNIKAVTAASKGFKLVWNKQSAADGYEVQYSTNKKFTGSATKKVAIGKSNTTTRQITGLKGNTNYYVRVRAYKVYNGKKYYSSWTGIKNVKTKK